MNHIMISFFFLSDCSTPQSWTSSFASWQKRVQFRWWWMLPLLKGRCSEPQPFIKSLSMWLMWSGVAPTTREHLILMVWCYLSRTIVQGNTSFELFHQIY